MNHVNIGSDIGLSLGRRQAIIGTNADLSTESMRTNFNQFLIKYRGFIEENGNAACQITAILFPPHFTDACIDGLVQHCSIFIGNALEILQSCIKPSICITRRYWFNWVSFVTQQIITMTHHQIHQLTWEFVYIAKIPHRFIKGLFITTCLFDFIKHLFIRKFEQAHYVLLNNSCSIFLAQICF